MCSELKQFCSGDNTSNVSEECFCVLFVFKCSEKGNKMGRNNQFQFFFLWGGVHRPTDGGQYAMDICLPYQKENVGLVHLGGPPGPPFMVCFCLFSLFFFVWNVNVNNGETSNYRSTFHDCV